MQTFQIGSPIVHPIHGAGIIKQIEKRQVRGKYQSYYVIDFPYSDLGQVMVPVEMAEKVGLRAVNSQNNIDEIFAALSENFSEEEEEESKSFHQRYREYLDKLQSGDLKQVAHVYRLLYRRNMIKPLGSKDKALFETARQLLVSEIAYARKISEQEAKDLLDQAMEDIVL